MAGMTTANMDGLIRSEVWSEQLKDVLYDELMAKQFVRWIDFPDGNQLTIPSIGQMDATDYVEDQAVQYTPLDIGEYNFTINQYKQAGTYITNKAKQDSFYASELIASFVPKMSRAIAEQLEAHIFREGQPRTGNPAGYQVAGSTNAINGVAHRRVASGTLNSKPVLSFGDFAMARFALQKANVPLRNLVAIVDPSTEVVLNTLTNVTSLAQTTPAWGNILGTGVGGGATGTRFVISLFGWDIYTSNYLPLSGTDQTGAAETIDGRASGTNAVTNLFFSTDSSVTPFIGAWRQMPKVDYEYNKDRQRDEYVTTCRYGTKIYRPENLVTILSDPTAVGA